MSFKELKYQVLLSTVYRVSRLRRVWCAYARDAIRYIRHSITLERGLDQRHLEAEITAAYHAIEKGLSLPTPRAQFGERAATRLLDLLTAYRLRRFPENAPIYQAALHALYAYEGHHVVSGADLGEIAQRIAELFKFDSISLVAATEMQSREKHARPCFRAFRRFAHNRHSVRNFTGEEVADGLIKEALEVAAQAPSACNRQCWNVILVKDRQKREATCELQNGNAGFGHLAGAILVITSDLRVFNGADNRNAAYVDGGIFSMAALFAFHAQGLGACALNWFASPESDKKLRALLKIPPHEVVIMCIAVGHLPERWSVARSLRRNVDEFLRIE